LQAGQFVELEVSLNNNGCYIQADKPVGICTYLTSARYNSDGFSDPAQSWLPSLEQMVTHALLAPFVPTGNTAIDEHYALVATPTATKNNTKVSIGGAPATDLSGGSWRDHAAAGMSFYTMPLINSTTSYHFTNQEGLIVLGYGLGYAESYYYLASSSNSTVAFYANDIYYRYLPPYAFCTNDIVFRAEVNEMSTAAGSLKWYIDGVEEVPARDQLTWSKYFPVGEYEIRMDVRFSDGDTATLKSTLNIGVPISATPSPVAAGIIVGDGCHKIGEQANLTAIPSPGYVFVDWTEDDIQVSANNPYTFTATGPRTLVANFALAMNDITVLADPFEGGTVSGGGTDIPYGTSITVSAVPNANYSFYNWTENGIQVSTDAFYTFAVTKSCTLVANFAHYIILLANPPEGGTVSGGGNNILHGRSITVWATANPNYIFINWTENGIPISTDIYYTFTVTESRTLVANFERMLYVDVDVNNDNYGSATGAGIYEKNTIVQVRAFSNSCYPFVNWTIDDVVVSIDNPYEFIVTEDVNIIANFGALDFDTYSPTLWNNTFMLNLIKLAEDDYEVTGCKWFKNGIEEKNTRTVDEFSYSAGPNIFDLLESAPTYYMFQLTTKNHGLLCSTNKMITDNDLPPGSKTGNLFIYPNPVMSGTPFTIEGVAKDSPIHIYNQYGICVNSAIVTDDITVFTLHLPAGIYFIRTNDKEAKIVIL